MIVHKKKERMPPLFYNLNGSQTYFTRNLDGRNPWRWPTESLGSTEHRSGNTALMYVFNG